MKPTLKNTLDTPEKTIESRKSIKKCDSNAFSLVDNECKQLL